MNSKFFSLVLLLFLFALPFSSFSQMFSVGDDRTAASNPFAPYLRAGISTVDFEYMGESNELIQQATLSFSGIVANFAYESNGFNIGGGLGGNITGLNDRRYYNLYLNFVNPFYLVTGQNFGIGIPVKLGTEVTSVRSDMIRDGFSQTNVGGGAGLVFSARSPQSFSIKTQFIPEIGFSTARGGFFGGRVLSLNGTARINFYNLLFGKNLSLGYDYNFDTYDIDGEEFDYDFSAHTLTIGISF